MWSPGHNLRGQGKGQKKIRRQSQLLEDRPSQGQGQECSRPKPRTQGASALKKKKKKSSILQKFFQATSKKKEKRSYREETPIFREKSGVLKKKINKGLRKFCARFLLFSKVKSKEGHGHGPFSTNQKECCP